jgi:Uma2 family endonuclease
MAIEYPVLRTRRWTRSEYGQLIAYGVLGEDEHLELLDGQLVVREPQGSRHSAAVVALQQALARAFGSGFHVRPQLPIALDDASEPEPDAVVVQGAPWDYASRHPAIPSLLVEIAETSLAIDRRYKGSLYARAGIADYWIVNLTESALEIYRDPVAVPTAPLGWEYRIRQRFTRGALVSPLAAPSARIAVADLLPPVS